MSSVLGSEQTSYFKFAEDKAVSQTLFYFSLRSFRKDQRASERARRARAALAVNKSPADLFFFFYHARSTKFEEKIEGL